MIFFIAALVVAAIIFVTITLIIGAVYVPTQEKVVREMIRLADVKKGEKAVDLGSGDGRIVIELAKKGAQAHGYEINPFLVVWSKFNVWRYGLEDTAFIHWKSFFDVDLSSYDVITIFIVKYMMSKVEKKVMTDAKKGARVVVESFPFKKWKASEKGTYSYIYKKS